MKPSSALQHPFQPVIVPSIAENNQADFECELAVVIGKPCKNAKESEALDYVLGNERSSASNDCLHACLESFFFTRLACPCD